jgi:hypothetical protein
MTDEQYDPNLHDRPDLGIVYAGSDPNHTAADKPHADVIAETIVRNYLAALAAETKEPPAPHQIETVSGDPNFTVDELPHFDVIKESMKAAVQNPATPRAEREQAKKILEITFGEELSDK